MWLTSSLEKLRNYWRQLIAPAVVIKDKREWQQARLLAGLSLGLFGVGTIVVFFWVLANPNFTAAPYISVGILVSLFVIYRLSRSNFYKFAATLFIFVMLLIVLSVVVTAPGPMSDRILALNFLIVAILLASLLVPIRQTIMVAVVSLIGTAVFFFFPSVPFAITYSYLVFIAIMAALLILASLLRDSYIRQLHESQHRYQALFHQSNDAVFIIDLFGKHIEANQIASNMLGYTLEELKSLSFRDIVAPDEIEHGEDVLRRLLADELLPIYERTFCKKDGSPLPVEVSVEIVKDSEGNPLHIQSVVRDISDRKMAENALKASEKRFRSLTLQSPDTIYIYNLSENKVEFMNNDSFLGYSLEELKQPGSILNQIHPEDMDRVLAFWQAFVRNGEGATAVDYRLLHHSGRWEWIHTRVNVLSHTRDNIPNEVLVVLTLITESKQAEEQLRQQEEYLRILLEQTPIGIATVDMAGNLTDANPRCLEILGAQDTKFEGPANLLQTPGLIEVGVSEMLQKALTTGELHEMETWYTSTWGKNVFLLIRAVPHFDGQSNQIGLIVLVEDLTERVQAEEGMRQMQKLESLSVLAGGIAHDFNNLLVAMLGQTSLAQAKLRPESPGRPHVEKAISAAERASQLTHQLLAYSGRGHFQVAYLDLNALIEENLHLFAATMPKHIHLRTKLAKTLPPVEVDVAQMQQVVMNLIINAAEAFEDERGTITIVTDLQHIAANEFQYWQYTMRPLVDGIYVTLEVHDDGAGMTQDTLANIFDPFFTTKEMGHGLGLAAVLGIIKGHRGGLTVYSEADKGSTFKILLPAATMPDASVHVEPIEEPINGNGLVLVIDDEKHVRTAVADILGLENIGTLSAADGKQGLALYQERRSEIAMVLLDLSMPGWSGEQTMRELLKVDPQIAIVLSSGYNEVEATRRFVGKGLVGFLQKPYSADKLLDTVRLYLQ